MPTFADMDDLYGTTVGKLSTAERLRYCIKHLDSAQHLLDKHANVLDSYQKNKIRSRIKAIQAEIRKLGK